MRASPRSSFRSPATVTGTHDRPRRRSGINFMNTIHEIEEVKNSTSVDTITSRAYLNFPLPPDVCDCCQRLAHQVDRSRFVDMNQQLFKWMHGTTPPYQDLDIVGPMMAVELKVKIWACASCRADIITRRQLFSHSYEGLVMSL